MLLLHLIGGPLRLHGMPLGGVVGEYTAELGVAMLGTAGTLLVAVAMLLLCVLAATPLSVHRGAVAVGRLGRLALAPLVRGLQVEPALDSALRAAAAKRQAAPRKPQASKRQPRASKPGAGKAAGAAARRGKATKAG